MHRWVGAALISVFVCIPGLGDSTIVPRVSVLEWRRGELRQVLMGAGSPGHFVDRDGTLTVAFEGDSEDALEISWADAARAVAVFSYLSAQKLQVKLVIDAEHLIRLSRGGLGSGQIPANHVQVAVGDYEAQTLSTFLFRLYGNGFVRSIGMRRGNWEKRLNAVLGKKRMTGCAARLQIEFKQK